MKMFAVISQCPVTGQVQVPVVRLNVLLGSNTAVVQLAMGVFTVSTSWVGLAVLMM